MKKLLFLSQGFPYPADGGGMIKTYNSLLTLAKTFEVYAIFMSEKTPSPKEIQFFTSKQIRIKVFPNTNVYKSVKTNLIWLLSNFARFKPHYQLQYEVTEAFPFIAKTIKDFQPEIIHIDHLNLAPYLPKEKKQVWVLEHHNVEFYLYWTRFVHTTKLTRKGYLLIEMILTYLMERKWLPRFDLIYAISNQEAQRIKRFFPVAGRKIVTQPLVYPLNHGANAPKKGSNKVLFVGNTRWPPNEDALEWLITSIWPRVMKVVPTAQLDIVGMEYRNLIDRLPSTPSVRFYGFKPSLEPFLKQASVFVMPFRMGGGVRIKTLTALAATIPIVSTTLGVEGLDLKHTDSVLIGDTSTQFAEGVVRMLSDEKLRKKIQTESRLYFKKNHSVKKNADYLREYIRQTNQIWKEIHG